MIKKNKNRPTYKKLSATVPTAFFWHGIFIRLPDKYPILLGTAIFPAADLDGLSRHVGNEHPRAADRHRDTTAGEQLTTSTLASRESPFASRHVLYLPAAASNLLTGDSLSQSLQLLIFRLLAFSIFVAECMVCGHCGPCTTAASTAPLNY